MISVGQFSVEDRAKPLIKRQLEAKIQQAEEEIESLSLEVEAALNEGASEVCNRRHEISALLVQGKLSRREKDELLKEFERLFFDPLYVKFWKSTLRLRDVRQRHRSLTLELKDLETVVDPPTAPAAQTSSLPAAATSEMPRLAANSSSLYSGSVSFVSESTSVWGWLRGLEGMDDKKKQKNY